MSKDELMDMAEQAGGAAAVFEDRDHHKKDHSYWRFSKVSRRWMISEKPSSDRRPAQFTWAKKQK